MPIVAQSTYECPTLFRNGHFQTILPAVIRRVSGVSYQRERIRTNDGDFLDLDWLKRGAKRVAVLSHGLEGDSKRHYMLGMARALAKGGWDVAAWNARGCSGEPNAVLRFTHSGATEDLGTVVAHIFSTTSYGELALIGFSLGGNLTLKYVGERGSALDTRIKAAVAFSVPCDLQSSSLILSRPANRIYMQRFLGSLRQKIQTMRMSMPGKIDDAGYEKLRTFKDFDDRYTAPIHGFQDAEDYWRKSSCKQFLTAISIPTLLVNARNDPFLAEDCFPLEEADRNGNLHLEIPRYGGHVGFMNFNREREYWSERRAAVFLSRAL